MITDNYIRGCADNTANQERANIVLVRRWHEDIWSRGDVSVIDEIVGEGYVKHWAAFPATVGREALRAHVIELRNSFPDWREEIDAIHASGDFVFVRWTESGTFSRDRSDLAATNRRGEVAGMGWLRILNGRIVEEWTTLDNWGMQKQLGVSYPDRWYKAGWDR